MDVVAVRTPVVLPDPSQLPSADVVIWDGHCNFCRSGVERLRRLDSNQLAYLSLHDQRTATLCPDLTHTQLMEQMWVVTAQGKKFGGADAAKYLSRKLPKLWWLIPLLHLPGSMPLWRWLYQRIALRRYQLAGKTCENGTCKLH
ncbi:MAG: DUF393 domain-containing protein [Pirellulaceae bacterium]|nr:DUF393 domain-containing protein [Pirellulaceae bacterium]